MKKPVFKFSFILLSALMINGCKKVTTPTNPTPAVSYSYSADLQSSKDISFATYAISDIDMVLAFIGEEWGISNFYNSKPPSTNTTTIIIDTLVKQEVMVFNNTECVDGKIRNGSIFGYYGYDAALNPGGSQISINYRDFRFSESVYLANYKVNGWTIALFDSTKPAHIVNKLTTSSYDPSKTNITWEISGKFKLTNTTAGNRDIIWDGTLIKTLINTNDPNVFNGDKQHGINWRFAKVSYSGTVSGSVNSGEAFTYTIDNSNLLTRDFNCKVIPVGSTGVTEFHPFLSGVSTFAWKNYDPRAINYGPSAACDNSGVVSFHNETYAVDFD